MKKQSIKKNSKLISVRLPCYLVESVSTLSNQSNYLTMSNVIKLGIMSVIESYGVSYESYKADFKH